MARKTSKTQATKTGAKKTGAKKAGAKKTGAKQTGASRTGAGNGKAAPGGARSRRGIAPLVFGRRWALRALGMVLVVVALSVLLLRVLPVPTTLTIEQARWQMGGVARQWLPLQDMPVDLRRAALAAEDARFCQHWGFDMAAIRAALADGAVRGASTITQQTVKNVWLWQGRSWLRKALETLLTPVVEAAWPKRRILEAYLNVAEFDAGVFGVEAAAFHYFGKVAGELRLEEAALLMAVLPAPKDRDAARPDAALRARAAAIADGARTLARLGGAACIED